MVRTQTIIKHRWLVLSVLALASIVFTGCDKGSLGIKTGAIKGYVLDNDTNAPISEVLVRAEGATGTGTENKSVYTEGDGSFIIGDASKGTWKLSVEKYGYELYTGTDANTAQNLSYTVNNGETLSISPIKMVKNSSNVKGTLKGYPIDIITGRPLSNFTVTQETPYNQRKSKTFETAADFRDSGWTSLEGGEHIYSIAAVNYKTFNTADNTDAYSPPPNTSSANGAITIGKSAANLGTIKMQPLTVAVSGTFKNMPGYILDAANKSIVVWAESAGKVVASYTELNADNSKGTITYQLADVPVTAGSVAIKCKVKGYDVITISSAVSIASTSPGGVIAGVDVDFSSQQPITADLRVIVRGNKPDSETPSTFQPGETARVYVKSGGNEVVPYADVVSVNYGGEVTIANVITGYPISLEVVNQDRKYCAVTVPDFTIPEGTSIYPVSTLLEEN